MVKKLIKHKNGLSIEIDKAGTDALGINQNTAIEMIIKDNMLIIKPKNKGLVLMFLLKNIFYCIAIALLCVATVDLSAALKKLKPKVGAIAPLFTLQGDDGKTYQLSDFNNQKVIVYFYPLDNSYYCTKQACNLAQGYALYKKNNIQLFGINHESVKSHAAFKEKNNLPFTLLSDPSCIVIKAYGAYSPFFVKRVTVLINKGKIVNILRTIDINNHADQILKAFDLKK